MEIELNIPTKVSEFLKVFFKNKLDIYIAGGSVRDMLINREVHDWDFTTPLPPEEIQKLFKNSFYNNDFGTVGVVFGEDVFEVTTFRTEQNYSDGRRPDKISWGKSIEEDLVRRDFRINAIALKPVFSGDTIKFEIIDPQGGIRDLKNKVVCCVGNPEERFMEDKLRMMRAVRIATQLSFEIEKNTFAAIKKNANKIVEISSERIRDELFKLLVADKAELGIVLLKESGLLEMIIPELLEGIGMDQKGHHIYDVWTHSIKSLSACKSKDPVTRLAVLLHDVGKPRTMQVRNGERTFYNHEVVGARMAKEIGKRLRLSNKQLDQLFKLVRWHMFTTEIIQTDSAVRRFIRNVTPEYLQEMIALRQSDRVGSGAKESSWRWKAFQERVEEVQEQPFSVNDLKVDGHDVMEILGIPPSKRVGEILKEIFEEVEKDVKLNEREILLEKLKTYEPKSTD